MTAVEHRAAARIAWRYARKAKARTALILFLIALPIAALATTGILITTVIANPQDRVTRDMGSADLRLDFPGIGATYDAAIKALPAGSAVDQVKGTTGYKVGNGTLYTLNVWDHSVPIDRAPASAQYKLVSGRAPHALGEAALSPSIARGLGVRLGEQLTLDGVKRPLTLVGLVWSRFSLRDTGVVVGPGTLSNQPNEIPPIVLIALPPRASLINAETAMTHARIGYQDRAIALRSAVDDQKRLTGLAFAGAIVVLFGTGMIVVTAFGVGARRQLRSYGLVGATGGEPRHVHAIVLWGGALLGAVGAALGVGIAVIAAYTAAPHIDGLTNRIIDVVRIPWWVFAGGITLGTVASTIAALAPARQAAQVSTLDALAGRSPQPRQPGRLARRGIAGIAIGCLFTVVATTTHEWTLLAIALIVTITGFLFAIPILVTFMGRWSAHFPAISRLAARQTARYGRRTGAAVAAATLALMTPIALSTLILSHDARDGRQVLLGGDQMTLASYRADQSVVPTSLVDAARTALPGAILGEPRFAIVRTKLQPGYAPGSNESQVQVTGPEPTQNEIANGTAVVSSGPLYVANAYVMRAAHGEAGIRYLDGDRVITVGLPIDNGVLHLEMGGAPGVQICASNGPCEAAPGAPSKMVDVKAMSVPGGEGDPNQVPRFFIPSHLLKKYGLQSSDPTQLLVRAQHTLSKAEIARVKHAASLVPGGYAQSQHDYVPDSTRARLVMTGAALVLALIIVGVAVGLVGAESRREQAILSAVGASPRVRRRLVGANALLMTSLAALLAVPAAMIPMALILISERPRQPVPTPWNVIGIVAIGAPLIAGLLAALASRAPKARAMLQPNW